MRQEDRHGLGPDPGFSVANTEVGAVKMSTLVTQDPWDTSQKHMLFLPVISLVKLINLGQRLEDKLGLKSFSCPWTESIK